MLLKALRQIAGDCGGAVFDRLPPIDKKVPADAALEILFTAATGVPVKLQGRLLVAPPEQARIIYRAVGDMAEQPWPNHKHEGLLNVPTTRWWKELYDRLKNGRLTEFYQAAA